MSAAQITKCARRISDEDAREEFLLLQREAHALIQRAAEMRREAWQIFYDATGEQPRAVKEMFR